MKKIKKASETVLITAFEETCKWSNFQGYGISMINGKNVLTGPGIETEPDKSGVGQMGSIQMGGEMWNRRLGSLCVEMVEEHGEWEIYKKIKDERNVCAEFCAKSKYEL
jgi:hypothetical protein